MIRKRTALDLLESWVEQKLSVAGEYSSNYIASYNEIITEAKAYASDLGITWDNKIVPEHVWDALEADRVFWEEL